MTIRPLKQSDKPLLQFWIEADPYHKDTTTADFFFDKSAGSFVFSDEQGPVLFVKFVKDLRDGKKELRLHTQFWNTQKLRNAKMLLKAFPIVEQWAKKADLGAIVFESVSPTLIGFMTRTQNFTRSTDYRKTL